jgi:glycosyltransferase involved in cell wall biosynthesis
MGTVEAPPTRVSAPGFNAQRIAILIPCFNEEAAIAAVVADFQAALPEATVYVYDNNSTDRTVELSSAAGAIVRRETRQGKGNVVRRMFSDVDADIYVLVDGDATYDAPSARALIAHLIEDRLEMVVAARIHRDERAYRTGHRIGNRLFTAFVASVFNAKFTDILSGYRVFSRRFVKSFPVLSRGFEIEIELGVHALELELPVAEIPTPYYTRREGSASKLSTWRDGFRILVTLINLYRAERPLAFFTGVGITLAITSIGFALPIFATYLQEGIVPRIPTAVLSTGLMLLAFLFGIAGLILDTVTRGRREVRLLAYLSQPAPDIDKDHGRFIPLAPSSLHAREQTFLYSSKGITQVE